MKYFAKFTNKLLRNHILSADMGLGYESLKCTLPL